VTGVSVTFCPKGAGRSKSRFHLKPALPRVSNTPTLPAAGWPR